jgi:hypothetical protein
MNKKWMPITAGILDVLYGAWYAFILSFTIMATLTSPWRDIYGVSTSEMIFWIIMIAFAVPAMVGGAYAFKRKRFWLVLAGTVVASIIPVAFVIDYWVRFDPSDLASLYRIQGFVGFPAFLWIPAVVAIILIILFRKQFAGKQA